MSTARFKELWEKYIGGTLRPEERLVFENFLLTLSEREISKVIDETIQVDMGIDYASEAIFERIESQIDQNNPRPIHRFGWLRYAAVFLIVGLLVVLTMDMDFWKEKRFRDAAATSVDLVLPEDKALVQLADGAVFVISDSVNRLETNEVVVRRISEGIYHFDVSVQPEGTDEFLSFSTPKGVSNQVILSDGTKVWLNAFSKLEVSSHFNVKNIREVRLTGEAYFEVAHEEERPFYVNTEDTQVQVVGTSFNVWARPGRGRVETTLIEGRVWVNQGQSGLFLEPGEQALTRSGHARIEKRKVNVSPAVAWKHGYFDFVNTPVTEILEELADWYDIEGIEWHKKTDESLTLSLARTRSLSELLDKIELITDLKFVIKERRLVVN